MVTQHKWYFEIDVDGAGTYTQLEGEYELPDIAFVNYTTRDATTIDVARDSNTKKHVFNRMQDGAEFSVQCDYLPGFPAQDVLVNTAGQDEGINLRVRIIGNLRTLEWTFNALVVKTTQQFAAASDDSAKEMITIDFKINSDVEKTDVATVG